MKDHPLIKEIGRRGGQLHQVCGCPVALHGFVPVQDAPTDDPARMPVSCYSCGMCPFRTVGQLFHESHPAEAFEPIYRPPPTDSRDRLAKKIIDHFRCTPGPDDGIDSPTPDGPVWMGE